MKLKIVYAILGILLMVALTGCSMIPEASDCGPHGECKEGYACDTDEKCHVCGNADGRVCCEGNKCEEGLICDAGDCRNCGGEWEPCCKGYTCDEYHDCDDYGTCHIQPGHVANYGSGTSSRG
ncbi:MAG: hypothetical protein ABH828_00540 [archaeon]